MSESAKPIANATIQARWPRPVGNTGGGEEVIFDLFDPEVTDEEMDTSETGTVTVVVVNYPRLFMNVNVVLPFQTSRNVDEGEGL